MTRWKYDAVQSHSLVKRRIPVTPGVPGHGYLVAVDKDSPHALSEHETQLIASFIAYCRETFYTRQERDLMDEQPFDIYPGSNTVIFRKYGTNDWGYRRRMWEAHRYTPPSPRVSTRRLGPWSLAELLEHLATDVERRSSWAVWKTHHQEVFG